jgi:hypothetical protein
MNRIQHHFKSTFFNVLSQFCTADFNLQQQEYLQTISSVSDSVLFSILSQLDFRIQPLDALYLNLSRAPFFLYLSLLRFTKLVLDLSLSQHVWLGNA